MCTWQGPKNFFYNLLLGCPHNLQFFLAISEAYVLFKSQRYYVLSRFIVLTGYYASIVYTFILYVLFGINNFLNI